MPSWRPPESSDEDAAHNISHHQHQDPPFEPSPKSPIHAEPVQNDGSVEDLLISSAQFQSFVALHAHLTAEGFAPIVENNNAMRGSYVMIDPLGRFFGNATGRLVYSQPILEVGVDAALAQVGFSPLKFEARGGRYAW